MFVSHLAQQGLTHQTIKVYMYLSAVRNLHVTAGLHNQFAAQLTPTLEMVLKGIKKDKAAATPRIRLPITVEVMERPRCTLTKKPTDHNNMMMWAACSLVFFGFLRCSKFTEEQCSPAVCTDTSGATGKTLQAAGVLSKLQKNYCTQYH